MIQINKAALAATLTVVSAAIVPAGGAWAQTTAHHSFFHRHAGATGVVGAVATHHALKVSARNAKRSGHKLSFAQRHPTLSAIGVGAAAHTAAKHTR